MTDDAIYYIPIQDLIVGAIYEVRARNFSVARWNGRDFEGHRFKFGSTFLSTEHHWDDGPPYGTVKPIKLLKDIKELENASSR